MQTLQSLPKANFKPIPYELYDYQKPIVQSMIDTILANKNGSVVQPTGTGKGVEAAFASRVCILLHKKRGLYVYDANDGIEQARKKFEEVVNGNNISFANFFGYGKDYHVTEADMVFASFQSLNNHHEKWYQLFAQDHFDFIIVNEGHHSHAPTYKEVLDHFNCSKISMTATPDRMDGKDILEIFHDVIAYIPLEEAIAKGWIAKLEYHVFSSGLSTQKLKEICEDVLQKGKRISIKQLNESIFIEKLDEQITVEIDKFAFPERNDPRQTLIFCENIIHAEYLFDLMKKQGKSVATIHSKKGKTANRKTIQDFKAGAIQFLLSIDMMNEDIDMPEAEVGVALRATNSNTVWLQQIGRILRLSLRKKTAIFLDFVANVQRLISVSDLSRRVIEIAKETGESFELDRNILNVSGEFFEFDFSHQIVDILKVVDAIRQGRYKTWQEASKVAIALEVTGHSDYKKKYRQDPKLPASPYDHYSDFPGWYIFLNKQEKKSYPTWQEASMAAISLEITSSNDYRKKYILDSLLPGSPDRKYSDFPGWYVFLMKEKKREKGSDFYETWQEASAAAIKLGINNNNEYDQRYHLDSRLPASLIQKYSDYPGSDVFFDKVYVNFQEASKAAIALGFKSSTDYKKNYKIDAKLHPNPSVKYSDFPGWHSFLGNEKRVPYKTWQEASAAALRLNIKNSTEYLKKYHQDLGLTSAPGSHYSDFPGWTEFLGEEKRIPYETLQEASKAAIAMGIKTCSQYWKRYKEDSRLVCNPYSKYPDFSGWASFLGGARKDSYPTWQEASAAAVKLGITTQEEYKLNYKKDVRLQASPDQFYPDFPGTVKFFNKVVLYSTWQEASQAAITLGIKTSIEYKKQYEKDSKLPGNPYSKYPDFPGWANFLSKTEFYKTWQEASVAAKTLGITSNKDYEKKYKLDTKLPSHLGQFYKDFPGLHVFLGKVKKTKSKK